MKIADLDFYLLEPPSCDADPTERTLLVRLASANSQEGWGEARAPWRASESAPRRERALSVLAGHNVADIEELLSIETLAPSGLAPRSRWPAGT